MDIVDLLGKFNMEDFIVIKKVVGNKFRLQIYLTRIATIGKKNGLDKSTPYPEIIHKLIHEKAKMRNLEYTWATAKFIIEEVN